MVHRVLLLHINNIGGIPTIDSKNTQLELSSSIECKELIYQRRRLRSYKTYTTCRTVVYDELSI